MAGACKNINPLLHSGTSQLQRVLKALDPASAPIDGRSAADFVLFAKEYARYLQFYDVRNQPDGNWQPLMQMDIAVVLATLGKEDMVLYSVYRRGINTEILSADENSGEKYLEALFDVLFTFIYHLNSQYLLLPDASDEKIFINNLILGSLKDAYQNLLAYYQEAKAAGIIDESSLFLPPVLTPPTDVQLTKALLQQKLSDIWLGTAATITTLSGSTKIQKIRNLVTHNLFNAAVDAVLKSIGVISKYASDALEQSLSDFPSHTPHYALYLVFIHLFKYQQQSINALPEKHLQFYYRQILQLKNKPAVPDTVNLTIELQKNTAALMLPAGTAFKAGKDTDGQEIFYATRQDFVVNQTKIKALKSLLKVAYTDNTYGSYQNIHKSEIANSDDGAGAALTSRDKSWSAFGDEKKLKETAALGFALTSVHFYLSEGKRVITITLNFKQAVTVNNLLLQKAFQIKLTGEKSWITVAPAQVTTTVKANQLVFSILLGPEIPAVVGYTEKLHQGWFHTTLPIVQFVLVMQRNMYNLYQALSTLTISTIQVKTQVEGLKKIAVSTDTGAVDAAKPFMPFGASPHLGSAFILGIKEAFQKPLTDLKLLFEWDKLPPEGLDIFEQNNYPYKDASGILRYRKHLVDLSYLQSGIWIDETEPRGLFTGKELFTSNFYSIWSRPENKYARTATDYAVDTWENSYDFVHCPLDKYQPSPIQDNQSDEKYKISSRDGFLKLELAGSDFGHDDYLDKVMNPVITSTTSGATVTQTRNTVKPPYTPVIKSVEVNYSSSSVLNLNGSANSAAFYYLMPFGFQEQQGSGFTWLPSFVNEGELYIGMQYAQPAQSVSFIFQLSEGSANPLKNKQEVLWSYLSTQNKWVSFDKYQVEDRTNGLLVSGLIIFQLPGNLAIDADLMDSGLAWIRASVAQNTDAICRIIDIQPQGIEAFFTDINGSGNQYKTHIPAGTISKLVISNPLIKKINQPFDSTGGAPTENDVTFNLRVSERLRHKQRAITIWDYERLVLQQFPDIYKVKCLNHTGLQGADWNELLSGHVTVITIPDLKNRNAVDPLLPYTSLGKLQEIQQYLSKLTSPFVQLQVVNPLFEEVQFDFEVRFFEQYDAGVYSGILNDAIEQFLSPWAFDTGKDIEFGGKISKSLVLKFIEDQYYVDYVSCFRMNHWIDVAANQVLKNVEEAIATTSRSILVSYHNPDNGAKHIIQPILTETNICDCV